MPNSATTTASYNPPLEIVSLTSLRGYLALWIVAYHFWNDALKLFSSTRVLSPLVQCGNIAVPMFFILSGFVLAYNYAERFDVLKGMEVWRFLGLRLARIYPVHVATLLVVLAMVWVSHRLGYQLTDSGYSTRDFVLNIFLAHTWVPDFKLNWNYPSWSISSEWFAYLFFPFACVAAGRALTTSRRAIAFGILMWGGFAATILNWSPWPYYQLFLVVPTFLGGMSIHWIAKCFQASHRTYHAIRFIPELLVASGVALCYVPSAFLTIIGLLAVFNLLVAVLVVNRVECSPLWTSPPAVFLGNVSYSLYMSHTLAQKVLYRLAPSAKFEQSNLAVRLTVLAVYAALISIFCLATFYVIEKPGRTYFKVLLKRK